MCSQNMKRGLVCCERGNLFYYHTKMKLKQKVVDMLPP